MNDKKNVFDIPIRPKKNLKEPDEIRTVVSNNPELPNDDIKEELNISNVPEVDDDSAIQSSAEDLNLVVQPPEEDLESNNGELDNQDNLSQPNPEIDSLQDDSEENLTLVTDDLEPENKILNEGQEIVINDSNDNISHDIKEPEEELNDSNNNLENSVDTPIDNSINDQTIDSTSSTLPEEPLSENELVAEQTEEIPEVVDNQGNPNLEESSLDNLNQDKSLSNEPVANEPINDNQNNIESANPVSNINDPSNINPNVLEENLNNQEQPPLIDSSLPNIDTNQIIDDSSQIITPFNEDPNGIPVSSGEDSSKPELVNNDLDNKSEDNNEPLNSTEEMTPMTLNVSTVNIPDTLESNFGVIGDDKTSVMPVVSSSEETNNVSSNKKQSEEAKKEKKPKKKSKHLKIIIPVILVILIFGLIGFGFYRFFFAVNPASDIAKKLRKIGNDYNSILSSNEIYKSMLNDSELMYSGIINVDNNDSKTVISLDGGLSKEIERLGLSIAINKDDIKEADLAFLILRNSYFINLVEDGNFYRFYPDNEIDVNNLIDIINLKTVFDGAANTFEKYFNKDMFSPNIMRVSINDKKKIVNNYTYTIKADKANEIIKSFLDSLQNETIKSILKEYLKPDLNSDVDLQAYVTLKGLEDVILYYDSHKIVISFLNDNSYKISFDSYDVTIIQKDNKIDLKINNNKTNKSSDINISWENEKKDNSSFYNLNIDYKKGNDITKIKFTNELKSVSSAALLNPYNIIEYDEYEVKSLYEDDLNKTLPYSKIISFIKK